MALSFGQTASIELLRAALSVILTAGMDITNRVTGATQKAFTDSINDMSKDTVINPVIFYDSDMSYETANDIRRYTENRMAFEIVSIIQGKIKTGGAAGLVNILKTLPITNYREKCVFSEDGEMTLLPNTEEVQALEDSQEVDNYESGYLKADEGIMSEKYLGTMDELSAKKSSIDSNIGSIFEGFASRYRITLDQFWEIVKSIRIDETVYAKEGCGPLLCPDGYTVTKNTSLVIPLFIADDSKINEILGEGYAEEILVSILQYYTTAFKNEFKNYDSDFAEVSQMETGEIVLEINPEYHTVTPTSSYGANPIGVNATMNGSIPVPALDPEETEADIILGTEEVTSADMMVPGVNVTAGELIGEAVRMAVANVGIDGFAKSTKLYGENNNITQRDGIGTIVDVVVPTMDSKGQLGNYKTTLTIKVTMIPVETSDVYELIVTNAQNRFNQRYDEYEKGRKKFWADVVMNIENIKARAKDKADRKILSELDILRRNVLDGKKLKPYNFFAMNKSTFNEIMKGKTDDTTVNAMLTRLSSLGVFLYDGSNYKVDYYYRGDRQFQSDELQNLVSDTDKYQKELKNLIKMNR